MKTETVQELEEAETAERIHVERELNHLMEMTLRMERELMSLSQEE